MATLREIELRLKSVRNIEKITKVSRRSPELDARILICCHVLVYENDCIYQARQSSTCYAEWEAVRNRKLWYDYVLHVLQDSQMNITLQSYSRMLNLRRHLNANSLSLYPRTRAFAAAFILLSRKRHVAPSPQEKTAGQPIHLLRSLATSPRLSFHASFLPISQSRSIKLVVTYQPSPMQQGSRT